MITTKPDGSMQFTFTKYQAMKALQYLLDNNLISPDKIWDACCKTVMEIKDDKFTVDESGEEIGWFGVPVEHSNAMYFLQLQNEMPTTTIKTSSKPSSGTTTRTYTKKEITPAMMKDEEEFNKIEDKLLPYFNKYPGIRNNQAKKKEYIEEAIQVLTDDEKEFLTLVFDKQLASGYTVKRPKDATRFLKEELLKA